RGHAQDVVDVGRGQRRGVERGANRPDADVECAVAELGLQVRDGLFGNAAGTRVRRRQVQVPLADVRGAQQLPDDPVLQPEQLTDLVLGVGPLRKRARHRRDRRRPPTGPHPVKAERLRITDHVAPIRPVQGNATTRTRETGPAGPADWARCYAHDVMSRPVHYRSHEADSARWVGFPFRADDIVISSRPRTGTTWVQMICALLVFQTPELPAPLWRLSPWIDHM